MSSWFHPSEGAAPGAIPRRVNMWRSSGCCWGHIQKQYCNLLSLSLIASCVHRSCVGEQLRAAEPTLHVLVHAAGVHHVASIEDHAAVAWDETWSVNVKSFFRLVQELLPGLRAAANPGEPARVIARGSADGLGVPQMDVYA